MEELLPKYRFNRVADITLDDIKKMGAKGIAVDLDNTIVFDGTSKMLDGAREWIEMILAENIPVCVLTNTYWARAKKLSRNAQIPHFVGFARKPREAGYTLAAKKMGIDCSEMVMLGDQIFADVLGANRSGAISVYINPVAMEKRYPNHFRKRRAMEKPILEEFERRKGIGQE